jgi:hypothetical protein
MYLFFTTRKNRRSREFGDIIMVLDHPGTDDDRTVSVCVEVTGAPDGIEERVQRPFTLYEEAGPVWFRRYSLWAGEKDPKKVAAYIQRNYPGFYNKLAPYFNPTTLQPKDQIPSVSWEVLKSKVWDRVAQATADLETVDLERMS